MCSATSPTRSAARACAWAIYYSLYEWYNPLWLYDKPRYVREHMFPQFKDLVTRYKPSIIFSDGEWEMTSADWHSPELLAWLFNESPVKDEVVINDRWGRTPATNTAAIGLRNIRAGMSGIDHPWEESRGMGFSYGYNRAENLEHYHTGRELVMMLVDIGQPRRQPAARHRARSRRHNPGDHGGAAHSDRRLAEDQWRCDLWHQPWKATQQWSAGEVPKVEYNKEYSIRL